MSEAAAWQRRILERLGKLDARMAALATRTTDALVKQERDALAIEEYKLCLRLRIAKL